MEYSSGKPIIFLAQHPPYTSPLHASGFRRFCHPNTVERPAITYAVIVSCQRHGNDQLPCLREVLSRLPGLTTRDDLDAQTPSRPSSIPAIDEQPRGTHFNCMTTDQDKVLKALADRSRRILLKK
jgi:hypothetical protein